MFIRPPLEIQVTSRQIPQWNCIPNTSIQSKPLMIYHQAFAASPEELKQHFRMVGEVTPGWVYTMYSQTHFHSTTHEVLGVVSGSAYLCFGGEGNPGRFETRVEKGDMIIIPAGVGHRLLHEPDLDKGSFKMVGAYPQNKTWDMCYGQSGDEEKCRNIESLGWFQADPLYGTDGPALRV
ncbi:cupin domain protein [Aspergillus rambellii]|uniref:Cupin domain protein n=1 Tax=Aspergillus rambellii TaxID=308745 RepID=A0A0F8UN67_9EURO|nr:cupin domain protein [Aspergillus rambellii]